MVTELNEKHFWQKQEDAEQLNYLKWRQESVLLKNALRELRRMREEYVLAHKICLGYQGKDVSARDLVDALSAVFALERRSVVTLADLEKIVSDYLPPAAYRQVCNWKTERDAFYNAETLAPNQKFSPISVARFVARLISTTPPDGGYDVPEIYINPMDLAVYFATEAQQPRWSEKSKQTFQKLALNLTQKHLKDNAHGMMQSLVWKEMHDIIVKDKVEPADHIRFELVGRAGQRFGIDLEDDLLSAHQEQLFTKPKEMEILAKLNKIQKRRHSVLGRLGLRRIHNVR
ncbi:MAG: hypothetical protein II942_00555 [Alphaproteobacteria bacterium]|nr:hypothetical protein [Alphaproteobacteria bacterium]